MSSTKEKNYVRKKKFFYENEQHIGTIQVEGVFGVLKEDYGFRRFLTRGKKNVETQFFLLAFALNIEKLCNREKKGRIGLDLFPLNAS